MERHLTPARIIVGAFVVGLAINVAVLLPYI